jgi:hypothetical protein
VQGSKDSEKEGGEGRERTREAGSGWVRRGGQEHNWGGHKRIKEAWGIAVDCIPDRGGRGRKKADGTFK